MACELCQPHEKPCRHEKEAAVPSITWLQTTPEIDALVNEMQDVLAVAKLRGIAKKHLDAAFDRGVKATLEAKELIEDSEEPPSERHHDDA